MESMGKKPRRRRSFTAEFKAEIVELCQRGDRSIGRSISPAIAPGRVQARADLSVAPARARGRHQPGGSAGGDRQLMSNSLPSGSFSATA
jgi:hypothetical protein